MRVTSIGQDIKATGNKKDNNKTKNQRAKNTTQGCRGKYEEAREKTETKEPTATLEQGINQLRNKDKGPTTCQRPAEAETKHGSN
jgi:hypothetical protein